MKSNLVSESDAYVLLAIAITRLAAKDYQREWRRFQRKGTPSEALAELEHWFTKGYGRIIAMGSGEYIMQQIQKGKTLSQAWGDDFEFE